MTDTLIVAKVGDYSCAQRRADQDCYDQLLAELTIHAPKVKKYIAFHDTQTYGTRSEEFMGRIGSNGLLPAIIHYLIENPD